MNVRYLNTADDELYFKEPFTKWQAWYDLLPLALCEDADFEYRGKLIHGMVITSALRRFLDDRKVYLLRLDTKGRLNRMTEEAKSAVTYEQYLKLKSGGKLPQTPNKAI